LFLVLLAACGTPGAPQAPSLNLPAPVVDLHATRKGNKVYLAWTVPRQNTDKTNVRRMGDTRVCRGARLSAAHCVEVGRVPSARLLQAGPAPPSTADQKPPPVRASYEDTLPDEMMARTPLGQVSYAVETLNSRGRSAGLSNEARVPLAPVFAAPREVKAEVTAGGVQLTWAGDAPEPSQRLAYRYRIYRQDQGPPQNKKAFANPQVIVAEMPMTQQASFLDPTIEWEKPYLYHVTAVTTAKPEHGGPLVVEGDDSPAVRVFTRDIFPPAVPAGVQAVFSGVGQQPFVDVTWVPGAEADLAGYNVYRREQGGTQMRINAALIQSPSFRDPSPASGRTYFYSVSAVDLRGNESARSKETAEQVP
jgi:hypothetical protein